MIQLMNIYVTFSHVASQFATLLVASEADVLRVCRVFLTKKLLLK